MRLYGLLGEQVRIRVQRNLELFLHKHNSPFTVSLKLL